MQGRTIQLLDGSHIRADTLGNRSGGTVTVNASEALEVIGTSADGKERSSLTTETRGNGNAGNLSITAKRFRIQDGAVVSTASSLSDGIDIGRRGRGAAGTLTVQASELVEVIGEKPDMEGQSRLTSQTRGRGVTTRAGDLTITTEKLTIQGGGQVVAGTFPRTEAAGGTLTINTGTLLVQGGAQIASGTRFFSTGQGGDLTVNAGSVQVIGESANGEVISRITNRTSGEGNVTNLTVNTRTLMLQEGGQISADTLSNGTGGNLRVNASDSIEVTGKSRDSSAASRLSAETNSQRSDAGPAGDLTIVTPRLSVRNGAEVSVSGRSAGGKQLGEISGAILLVLSILKLVFGWQQSEIKHSVMLRKNSEISDEAQRLLDRKVTNRDVIEQFLRRVRDGSTISFGGIPSGPASAKTKTLDSSHKSKCPRCGYEF